MQAKVSHNYAKLTLGFLFTFLLHNLFPNKNVSSSVKSVIIMSLNIPFISNQNPDQANGQQEGTF